MPIFHVAGNVFADKWAGHAAANCRIDEATRKSLHIVDGLTWKVQSRIVAAVQLAQTISARPKRAPRDGPQQQQPRSTEELLTALADLGHVFELSGMSKPRRACTRCMRTARDGELLALLGAGPCAMVTELTSAGSANLAPQRVLGVHLLGTTAVHDSHNLWRSRDVFFCSRCGAWARLFPRDLARECK